MEIFHWLVAHAFDFVGTVGVVASLLFTAASFRKDERSRKISNLIAIKSQYQDIWQRLYDRPQLSRILKPNIDLDKQPVTDEENFFVGLLILHLDTVRRAMDEGMFFKVGELQRDIQSFLSLPIPKAVWEKLKPFQDEKFVAFVEKGLRS